MADDHSSSYTKSILMKAPLDKRPIALITGASSGIGASFALAFAKKNHDLILTGRRVKQLNSIVVKCRERVSVHPLIAELTDPKAVDHLVAVGKKLGVDVLINNAGFGTRNSFIEDRFENQTRMVDIHVLNMLRLIHNFLPRMIKNNKGVIINVSSIIGCMNTPGAGMYCATKAFIVAFSEVLHMELAQTGIKIQALCPGFTRTDFHKKIGITEPEINRSKILRWMNPEEVVSYSLRCLERDKFLCIPGMAYRMVYYIQKMLPMRVYHRIMKKMALEAAKV